MKTSIAIFNYTYNKPILHTDWSRAPRIQGPSATFTKSSFHHLGGLPRLGIAVRGLYSRTVPPQGPSVLLTICPAHCHIDDDDKPSNSLRLGMRSHFVNESLVLLLGIFNCGGNGLYRSWPRPVGSASF